METNSDDISIVLIDRLLPFYPDFDSFDQALISSNDKSTWSEGDKSDLYYSRERIRKLLLKFGYATENDYSHELELTDTGRDAKKAGGHFAYLKQLANKANRDLERQKLNDEKLKLDVRNSKRIFKTYWWTFAFALVSFIYVLIQIVLKISGK